MYPNDSILNAQFLHFKSVISPIWCPKSAMRSFHYGDSLDLDFRWSTHPKNKDNVLAKTRTYFGFSTSILLTVAVLLELTLSALSIPFVFGLFNDIVLFCNLSNGSIAAAFHYMLTTLINYFS